MNSWFVICLLIVKVIGVLDQESRSRVGALLALQRQHALLKSSSAEIVGQIEGLVNQIESYRLIERGREVTLTNKQMRNTDLHPVLTEAITRLSNQPNQVCRHSAARAQANALEAAYNRLLNELEEIQVDLDSVIMRFSGIRTEIIQKYEVERRRFEDVYDASVESLEKMRSDMELLQYKSSMVDFWTFVELEKFPAADGESLSITLPDVLDKISEALSTLMRSYFLSSEDRDFSEQFNRLFREIEVSLGPRKLTRATLEGLVKVVLKGEIEPLTQIMDQMIDSLSKQVEESRLHVFRLTEDVIELRSVVLSGH
jgi:hypothetical protein